MGIVYLLYLITFRWFVDVHVVKRSPVCLNERKYTRHVVRVCVLEGVLRMKVIL